MKHTFTRIILAATIAVIGKGSFAQTPQITNIDINNIDAMVSSSADLFWDFSNPGFEIPKGSGLHAIYAGTLWIGGLDPDTAIHMSVQTYSQSGYDYQPGPIDTISGTPASVAAWNKSWKVNKQDVLDHQANFTNVNYVVPQNIADWPGYNASLGRVLAPFADYNGNGIYDPANGDYPWILGDQTVYSIFNDVTLHTESNCDTLGIEVHRTVWGFDQPSNTALNNSIFSRYEIKNYSNTDYSNVFIALWTDFDLGMPMDDYVGTDISLNMVYCYNGDIDDEGASGYGLNPPAVGVYFLNTPLYGSLVYDNVNGVPSGNPGGCNDYRNYLTSFWLDNAPITYGGMGSSPGGPTTTYMYPGTTDPVMYPLYGPWSEMSAGNPAGDRRALGTIGPISIPAYGYYTFDAGYTWSRATSGGPLASVTLLQSDVQSLRVMYDNGQITALPEAPLASKANSLNLFPNPGRDRVTLSNLPMGRLVTVTITDLTGKCVFKKTLTPDGTLELDVQHFERGVYEIEVIDEHSVRQVKLVLQ